MKAKELLDVIDEGNQVVVVDFSAPAGDMKIFEGRCKPARFEGFGEAEVKFVQSVKDKILIIVDLEE